MESSVEESKETRSFLFMSSLKQTCLSRVESLWLLGLKFGTILWGHTFVRMVRAVRSLISGDVL